MTLIETVLAAQIAALRASAGTFVQRRAEALAAADAAAVEAASSAARADELQTELDAYRALLPAPDLPAEPAAAEPPAEPAP